MKLTQRQKEVIYKFAVGMQIELPTKEDAVKYLQEWTGSKREAEDLIKRKIFGIFENPQKKALAASFKPGIVKYGNLTYVARKPNYLYLALDPNCKDREALEVMNNAAEDISGYYGQGSGHYTGD